MTENQILDDLLNETKSIVLEILNKLIGHAFKNNLKFFIEINLVYVNYMIITLNYATSKIEGYLDVISENTFLNGIVT